MARIKKIHIHRPEIEVISQAPFRARLFILKHWKSLHKLAKIIIGADINGRQQTTKTLHIIIWPKFIFKKGDPN